MKYNQIYIDEVKLRVRAQEVGTSIDKVGALEDRVEALEDQSPQETRSDPESNIGLEPLRLVPQN